MFRNSVSALPGTPLGCCWWVCTDPLGEARRRLATLSAVFGLITASGWRGLVSPCGLHASAADYATSRLNHAPVRRGHGMRHGLQRSRTVSRHSLTAHDESPYGSCLVTLDVGNHQTRSSQRGLSFLVAAF